MERQYTQPELEQAVKNWLVDMIQRIESDRARKAQASASAHTKEIPPPGC
jgi:hypothetical protein